METNQTIPPMPPKVAAAIAAVMKAVPKLAKGERNAHSNYNFASIDDFLEAVRPLCAENGLIILQDEDSFETKEGAGKDGKPKVWLLMRFAYTLAHSSGETWAYRPMRTIMVDGSMGSQAFGAAQSYSLKQFQRSLFQIATGDKEDADTHEQTDLPNAKGNGARKAAPKPSPETETWKANAEAIKQAIDNAHDHKELADSIKADTKALEDIKLHSVTAYEFLMDRVEKRAARLSQKAA